MIQYRSIIEKRGEILQSYIYCSTLSLDIYTSVHRAKLLIKLMIFQNYSVATRFITYNHNADKHKILSYFNFIAMSIQCHATNYYHRQNNIVKTHNLSVSF